MTPDEFIATLFGDGIDQENLPVLSEIVKGWAADAARYHEIRDRVIEHLDPDCFISSRQDLRLIDELMDKKTPTAEDGG